MTNKKREKINILYSCIAAIIIIILFIANKNTNTMQVVEKNVLSIIFIILCCLGIMATIFPNQIRKKFKQRPAKNTINNSQQQNISIKGHHPTCIHFKDHTIKYHNNIYCAGCIGLAIGAIIAIIIMIMYIADLISESIIINEFLLILGFICIFQIFIQILVTKTNTTIHIVSNMFFIIGFSFIVLAIAFQTKNLFYGLICLLFCLLWLDTRIILSKNKHNELCRQCPDQCSIT